MHTPTRSASVLAPLSLLLLGLATIVLSTCGPNYPIGGRDGGSVSANSNTAPLATPTSYATSVGDKIGVPECDDFIAKYDACVSDKVPEVARAQYKASIEQWRTTWRQLAANPNTKATLATACKRAAETARTSMKTYNCTW